MKILVLLVAGFCFTVEGLSQKILGHSKVTRQRELNLRTTEKRGIEADDGVIYMVEKDGQTLAAYEGGEISWTVNIVETCGQPVIGRTEIRYLKLSHANIQVTFGKHDFATVNLDNGQIECLGSD
jgi:hypothetical protein